jgi:hypothetical protein
VLAIAERDRISLWDVATGRHLGDVWSRNSFLDAALFSIGFIGWAVVWGFMRRDRSIAPQIIGGDRPVAANSSFVVLARWRSTWMSSRFSAVRALIAVLIFFVCGWLLWRFASQMLGFGPLPTSSVAAAAWFLLAMTVLVLLIVSILVVTKMLLHSHVFELQRAVSKARGPCRTAAFGRIHAYFFGESKLDETFAQDLSIVRVRLTELLGELAEPPCVPVFCFERQDEFDAHLGRQWSIGGVYLRSWWNRQLVLCEHPAYGGDDPRELLRSLLGTLFLWNHKGFALPTWITEIVCAYCTYGEAQFARARRRLRAELTRAGTIDCWPHKLSDRQVFEQAITREDRELFLNQLLYDDICASLAEWLTSDAQRRGQFRALLCGLRRRDSVEAAFQQHFGHGPDELMDDWLTWLRERIADDRELDRRTPPTEFVRRQISEVELPILSNLDLDPAVRCRAARNLGAFGSTLAVEALIDTLTTGPAPLQADARWALEAISGRLLGDDPAAWRQWLQESASRESRLEANAAFAGDTAPENWLAGDDREASEATYPPTDDRTGIAQPASQPLRVAPRALAACWGCMVLGGAAAILLPAYVLFEIGLTWWPFYFGIPVGVFAIARGVGRHTRWMQAVALLQVLALFSCDPINPIFGVVTLALLRTRRVRAYLAAQ